MGPLATILGLPISGPIGARTWIARQIANAAMQEMLDPDRIETALLLLERKLEDGQIDEATFEAEEDRLLQELAEITELRAAEAAEGAEDTVDDDTVSDDITDDDPADGDFVSEFEQTPESNPASLTAAAPRPYPVMLGERSPPTTLATLPPQVRDNAQAAQATNPETRQLTTAHAPCPLT
jgi:hypothetical protein